MTLSKIELRALEYRARADAASTSAQACTLDRSREQHEIAARRWTELAEAEESRASSARIRLSEAPVAE